MKIVNKVLKENKANVKSLPVELQNEVETLKEIIVKFNLAVDAAEEEEEDEETTKKLDAMEDNIANKDQELGEKVKAYFLQKKEQEEKAKKEEEEKNNAPAPAPVPVEEEKKDNSVGWLIFAGVVFAATLGVVNIMKKRA